MFRIRPVLVVQGGGYPTTSLSADTRALFRDLHAGSIAPAARR